MCAVCLHAGALAYTSAEIAVRRRLQEEFDGRRKENLVTPPPWANAAIRSVIWLGGAAGLAYFKKPDGASVLAVRPDAIGWLAGSISVAGLALHVWSNVSLARGTASLALQSGLCIMPT